MYIQLSKLRGWNRRAPKHFTLTMAQRRVAFSDNTSLIDTSSSTLCFTPAIYFLLHVFSSITVGAYVAELDHTLEPEVS